jgi:hypothetical protein
LFEKIEPGQDVEFEVIGTQFKQGDEEIIVVAKLVGQAEETTAQAIEIPEVAPIPKQSGEVMQVIINPVQSDEKPKKRKLKRSEDVEAK